MKKVSDRVEFDSIIETSDWRYNASIVGLKKYFDFLITEYGEDKCNLYLIKYDEFYYNKSKIDEERYLLFVEKYFKEGMHHKIIEDILNNGEITEDDIVIVNSKLRANAPMKKVFGTIKYPETNKDDILEIISSNRLELIKETFRRAKPMYGNFANESSLLADSLSVCRLNNYYVDMNRKSRWLSYNWDNTTYAYHDEMEFDFIPFAFSKSYNSFFINCSSSVDDLIKYNTVVDNLSNLLIKDMKTLSNFIDFDVEVIVKDRDRDYYRTVYIRKKSIEIFKKIDNYGDIQFSYKISKDNFINIEDTIVDSILNNLRLDSLIELLFKGGFKGYYKLRKIIEINTLIYGEDIMNKNMKIAYATAREIANKIPENKVRSYRQKLVSSLVFKDYDRCCEILLQLSAYSGIVMTFAYDLFGDFDKNKNIIYTFINALNCGNKGGEENE